MLHQIKTDRVGMFGATFFTRGNPNPRTKKRSQPPLYVDNHKIYLYNYVLIFFK